MRLKSARFILAAFFLVLLIGPRNLLADSLSKHMKNADDFMSKGEFESAIVEYQKAVRREPKSVWAQSRLGMAYMELGKRLFNKGEMDQAIDAYKNALAAEPEEPYWHERLGAALEKKGDREAAIKEYHTAVEILPLDDELQSKYQQLSGGPQGDEVACSKKAKLPDGIETGHGKIGAPFPIAKPAPPYSEWARQARLQGTVVLWIVVDREGNVVCTTNVKPLGLGLDANALETVRTWKFQPAMRDGTPVPVRVMVEVSFKLH